MSGRKPDAVKGKDELEDDSDFELQEEEDVEDTLDQEEEDEDKDDRKEEEKALAEEAEM